MSVDKIDITPIVVGHFRTLRTANSNRTDWWDLLVHAGIPVLAGALAYLGDARFDQNSSAIAMTALSVFVGLLFNLLVLSSTLRLANRGSVLSSKAKNMSAQILVNLEFAILVAFAAIAVLAPSIVTVTLPPELLKINSQAQRFQSVVFVTLIASFAVTLLMVLRRMHIAMLRNMELSYAAAPEIANRSGRAAQPHTSESEGTLAP